MKVIVCLKFLIFLFLSLGFLACTGSDPKSDKRLSAEEANSKKKSKKNSKDQNPASIETINVGKGNLDTLGSNRNQDIDPDSDEFVGLKLPGDHPDILSKNENKQLAMTDEQVVAYFDKSCASCHGEGAEAANFWLWEKPENIKLYFVESNESSEIYQSILNQFSESPTIRPLPMPHGLKLNEENKKEASTLLAWFHENQKDVVQRAQIRYGKTDLSPAITAEKCETISKKAYLTRVFQSALDRNPTTTEVNLLGNDSNNPVSEESMKEIVDDLLTGTHSGEFRSSGLRKLSDVISGAATVDSRVKNLSGSRFEYSAAQRDQLLNDIKDEFYQKLNNAYASKPVWDIFFENKVMATELTSKFYKDCEVPAELPEGERWFECELSGNRTSFFGTVGFLAGKPSTFLRENNNYGRVARMYFLLFGKPFLAATNLAGADGEVPPLPSCLEVEDSRFFEGAARGIASIPESNAVCQTCHISKNLASGAVLFRPFSEHGYQYLKETFGTNTGADSLAFRQMTQSTDWKFERKPSLQAALDCTVQNPEGSDSATTTVAAGTALPENAGNCLVRKAYLDHLLEIPKKACVVSGKSGDEPKIVNDLQGFMDAIVPDKSEFVTGMMIHLERTFRNKTKPDQLASLYANQFYQAGDNTLKDMLKLHFMSKSYQCK